MNDPIIPSDMAIMPIGAMAQHLGVHVRTLRIYDIEGILVPTRTVKNRRYYCLNDIEKAKLILFLTRNLSINIAGVKIIMKMLDEAKVAPSKQFDYVKKIATLANITEEIQEDNCVKNAKKGKRTSTAKK